MNEADIIALARESIMVTLKVGGPILVIALLVGTIVSLFQALTSIQEATLSFVPKILIVFLSFLVLLPYMMDVMKGFMVIITDRMSSV